MTARKSTAVDVATENKSTVTKAAKFKLSNLRAHSTELFNVGKTAFDGATYKLNSEDEYTVEEVKKIINKWLNEEVK